jgi:CRISPR-associated protein Csb1
MTPEQLIRDERILALTVRQPLEPIEGRDMPIFPATYMKPEEREHKHKTPYTINEGFDGQLVAELDSVQSQANRMERSFSTGLAWAVPQVRVRAGDADKYLTELSHRTADAALRSTELAPQMREAFAAHSRGERGPMVRLGPTSLVYGAWDSRDTRIKVARVIASRIQAMDVAVQTRSAQFSGNFDRENMGFDENEWARGAQTSGPSAAKAGFAPAASIDDHGGVLVRGPIKQVASVHLGAIRALDQTAKEDDLHVASYILSLALAGLFHGGREYQLRSGCWLVPDGPPQMTAVTADGDQLRLEFTRESIKEELEEHVARMESHLGVTFGTAGEQVVEFDPETAKRLVRGSSKSKNADGDS